MERLGAPKWLPRQLLAPATLVRLRIRLRAGGGAILGRWALAHLRLPVFSLKRFG